MYQGVKEETIEARIEAEFHQIRTMVEESLVGETVYTPKQHKPNEIIDAHEEGLTVLARTEREVPWEWIQGVYDVLAHRGEIEFKDVQQGESRVRGGFRSSFIFALLARFAHIDVRTSPRTRLIYHEPERQTRLGDGGG